MKDVPQSATNATLGASAVSSATVATGILEQINNYAPAIGLLLSFFSMLLGVIFYIMNVRREAKKELIYRGIMEERIRRQVIDELKSIENPKLENQKRGKTNETFNQT